MTQAPHKPEETAVSAALFAEIQQFYGRHMRAMDEGRVADWTDDFTHDAVFATNARPEPQRGRAEIAQNAEAAARQLQEKGILRRHCVTTMELQQATGLTLLAKTYALITKTVVGGRSELEFVCTCEDVLARHEDRWFIRHRQVFRDDLPKG
ncbi:MULTISPECIES: nuclear transport factor 2 family protein [Streptomyces]|uniref:SnoaL-like domain-containing protein n=1 Tax=Streptomyces atratus TaxID=1893 RepID=A0A1K1X7H9_STRAR|nr:MULTISPECIES: nuclear transport factor 2 family protein [Streptomyces]MCX4393247.1 nuclear transport factor 2 family protein [Streptomyces sp. NBC_01767]MCX4849000.1 nuclear transport factor 2 family protein [Streptomyces sp. NBC_00893]SFX45100.1 SnoaL-like domain-containing protein [Streptomyces atratus]